MVNVYDFYYIVLPDAILKVGGMSQGENIKDVIIELFIRAVVLSSAIVKYPAVKVVVE